jgi:hypothetical protein
MQFKLKPKELPPEAKRGRKSIESVREEQRGTLDGKVNTDSEHIKCPVHGTRLSRKDGLCMIYMHYPLGRYYSEQEYMDAYDKLRRGASYDDVRISRDIREELAKAGEAVINDV